MCVVGKIFLFALLNGVTGAGDVDKVDAGATDVEVLVVFTVGLAVKFGLLGDVCIDDGEPESVGNPGTDVDFAVVFGGL